ncbi:MAG: Exodeoxyribonuclease 7 large subunit [Planctomycetes bacterium ADurb.Bin401]|nr:MAG: Exodeoxyribonuclease 7 large subunit [Planctomycetes bacterium ADurb.Bin401]
MESLFDQPKEPVKPQPVSKRKEQQEKIYTVSQVTSLIKMCLENTLPGRLTISGEISGWRKHSSGHCYLDIKDENAIIPTVMWKSDFAKLKFKPENGLAILVKGYVDIYPPQGKYQFYAETMQPAGVGSLQLAFEQMKNKLQAEGLFNEEHKRELPKYPFRIGIMTSKSGAALHDIVDSIRNRWPVAKLLFYDVPVQGQGAAERIAIAIRDVNKRNNVLKLDILIVGRGGGSMEDLWAFNEEPVARAIFGSKIPVISAVGHEVDVTIADMVADARASTPTKAGVIVVPDIDEVFRQLDNVAKRIKSDTDSLLNLSSQKLKTILAAAAFRNPKVIIQNRQQRLDEFENKISDSTKTVISNLNHLLHTFFEEILKIEPHKLLADRKIALNNLQNRCAGAERKILHVFDLKLTECASRLGGLNPKSVLGRGYSITRNKRTSTIIKSVNDVEDSEVIVTEFANENMIESRVVKK